MDLTSKIGDFKQTVCDEQNFIIARVETAYY